VRPLKVYHLRDLPPPPTLLERITAPVQKQP
jgi:hypothetical protein